MEKKLKLYPSNEAIKTRETASSFARQLIKHSFVTERDAGVNSLLLV